MLKARENKYAVPAFNFDNLAMMKGIIQAAEETRSPVILMVTESAAKHIGIDFCFSIINVAVKKTKVPVVVHWDHGFDFELIKKAVDAGFSSVMLDSSLKPFAENVKETKAVCAYAHSKGVEVESEIGHVGGKEDDRISNINFYTDVDEAVMFDKSTQIDALAVAIGTSHGLFNKKINLQFDLLKQLANKINTPLVLHGSSQVPLTDLQKCINLGITKINIGTDLKIAYALGVKKYFQANPGDFDARKFEKIGTDFVKEEAIKKIKAFRSNNKA